MPQYAGSDWIEKSLNIQNMSPLGKVAADFLGDVFQGIYHLNTHALRAVDWSDKWCIQFNLGWRELATVDGNKLTRMVVLAHDRMLRIGLEPYTFHHIKISICQRTVRTGNLTERCPTLIDHIKLIREHYHSEELHNIN